MLKKCRGKGEKIRFGPWLRSSTLFAFSNMGMPPYDALQRSYVVCSIGKNIFWLLCTKAISLQYAYYTTMGLLLYFDETQKRNVNPGLSYFEWCSLACTFISKITFTFTFCFCQSKATLPMYVLHGVYLFERPLKS